MRSINPRLTPTLFITLMIMTINLNAAPIQHLTPIPSQTTPWQDSWQEIHGAWDVMSDNNPISASVVTAHGNQIIFGFNGVVEKNGSDLLRFSAAGIQLYDLTTQSWLQLHSGGSRSGWSCFHRGQECFLVDSLLYLNSPAEHGIIAAVNRGLKATSHLFALDLNHFDILKPDNQNWVDFEVKQAITQLALLANNDLIASFEDGSVKLYHFSHKSASQLFDGKWHQLKDQSWHTDITQIKVLTSGDFVVGLANGGVKLFHFNDPLQPDQGGRWLELQDTRWARPITQIQELANGDLVVGLAWGAVEGCHFKDTHNLNQGWNWVELHNNDWGYGDDKRQAVRQMVIDSASNDLIIGLGSIFYASNVAYPNNDKAPGTVYKYSFKSLQSGVDPFTSTNLQGQELRNDGWGSGVTQMLITPARQLIVGLGNGAVETLDLTQVPLNPNAAWVEFHDKGWINPISQLQLLTDNGSQYLLVGLGVYMDHLDYTDHPGGQVQLLKLTKSPN